MGVRAMGMRTGWPCSGSGAGWPALLLAVGALAGAPAQAQQAPAGGKPARVALPDFGVVQRSWRAVGGDAYQRIYLGPGGERAAIASTAPLGGPGVLEVLGPQGFAVRQPALEIALPASTQGEPVSFVLAEDGASVRLSTAVRLFARPEGGAAWELLARRVAGELGGETAVHYPGVIEDATLVYEAGAGTLKTALVLQRLPEPLGPAQPQVETVWFEETVLLPQGWTIPGLEAGAALRTEQSLPVFDAQGRERLRLQAPVVYEQRTPKDAPGHFARCFAELRLAKQGVLLWRVGIPAAWLAAPERSYPVVIDPALSRNQPLVVSTDPTQFTISPLPMFWNAVAVSSAGADWDMSIGSAVSWEFPPAADFLVANGNKGTISPTSGEVHIFGSATGPATLEHAGITGVTVGNSASYTWTASHVIHLFEVYVPAGSTGPRQLTVNGPSGLRWALFRPGSTSAWKSVNAADYVFAVGPTARAVDLNESGFWALVVVKDGGPGASGTVTIDWSGQGTPGFDLVATSVSLDAASYPVALQPGDRFTFTREITRIGSQPAGTQIDYAVYLSANTVISTQDYEAYSWQDAGAGRLTLTGTVPANIPPGTYYVGLRVVPVPGEASTSNNTTYDAVTGHQIVIGSQTPQIALSPGQPAQLSHDPTDFTLSPQAGFWNLVAMRSDDWDMTIGSAFSAQSGARVDFLVADGNVGTISSTSGSAYRWSGTGGATLLHAGTPNLIPSASGQLSTAWAAGTFARHFEHLVSTTGPRQVSVSGPAGLRWALFPPANDTNWLRRSLAAHDFAAGTPQTVDFHRTGWWLLVVYKDGAASASGNLDIQIGQPSTPSTFDVAVSSVVLGGSSFPLQVRPGDMVQLTRTIDVSGQLPAGASISYKVYLSTDTTFDASDTQIYSSSSAAQGTFTLSAPVPQSMAPGLYHVGVVVDPIPGEQSATNNTKAEDGGRQVQVVPPPAPLNVAAAGVAVAGGAVSVAPGGSFQVHRTVTVTGTLPGPYTLKLYLSADRQLDPQADILVLSGQGTQTSGSVIETATVPPGTAAGSYHVILAIDPLAGETNTQDNVIATAAPDVTVTGTAPPPQGLTLVQGQPQATPSAQTLPFTFTPQAGAWNVIAVVANDPADDWDIEIGNGLSAELPPACDFVLYDGHQGPVPNTAGEVQLFSGSSGARVEHADVHPTVLGQNAVAPWGTDDVVLVFEVDVQNPASRDVVLSGPSGLRWAVFPPGSAGWWDDRGLASAEFDAGPTPRTVDFLSPGVWALVVFAEAGVNPPAGTVALDFAGSGPGPSGFDLAASAIAVGPAVTLQPGASFAADLTIDNLGAADSPLYVYAIYLSADTTLDPATDIRVFESIAGAPVPAGQSASWRETVTLPQAVPAGTYYVALLVPQLQGDADPGNGVAISAHTITVGQGGSTGGGSTGSGGIRRKSGGGGCAIGPAGAAPGGLPLVLLLGGLLLAARQARRREA
ncbi:MAG: hypothetical protein KatS3mg102_2750 [Planctomycetota bacterium]|nr:MAG: hypothetical protein KatS3mg102_2750 [Planctomycetota bacterium]